MKTAKDYPVSFPYGATSFPYTVANPHKGDDRKMPYQTPVVVNGVLIGLAGSTGNSTGVHTHTQKVANGVVVNPKGQGFDVASPAIVTEKGYKSGNGNYVRYRDSAGVVWSVFHLDEIKCTVGTILERKDMQQMTQAQAEKVVTYLYRLGTGQYATQGQAEYWVSRVRDVATGTDELGNEMLKAQKPAQYVAIKEQLYRKA